MELLESQKSSFSIFPGLKGLSKILDGFFYFSREKNFPFKRNNKYKEMGRRRTQMRSPEKYLAHTKYISLIKSSTKRPSNFSNKLENVNYMMLEIIINYSKNIVKPKRKYKTNVVKKLIFLEKSLLNDIKECKQKLNTRSMTILGTALEKQASGIVMGLAKSQKN